MQDIFIKFPMHTYDTIYAEAEYPDDALALFLSYHMAVKEQDTDTPHITKEFYNNRFKWSKKQVERAQRDLLKLKLIEFIPASDEDPKDRVLVNSITESQIKRHLEVCV